MSMGFSEIIGAIQGAIAEEYLGGAIAWADAKYDNAWSNAMDRFEQALCGAIERQDYRSAELAGADYKRVALGFIAEFKAAKGISDATTFLEQLELEATTDPDEPRAQLIREPGA